MRRELDGRDEPVYELLGLQEEEEIVEREQISREEDEYEPAPVENRKNQRANVVSIHSQKM